MTTCFNVKKKYLYVGIIYNNGIMWYDLKFENVGSV